jgi:YidC/Oxa1 family membrane protein insertase
MAKNKKRRNKQKNIAQPITPAKKPSMFSTRSMLTILGIAVALNLIINLFTPKAEPQQGVFIATSKPDFSIGQTVTVTITNATDEELVIADDCPSEPLVVEKRDGDKWIQLDATVEGAKCPIIESPLAAQSKLSFKYAYWNEQLFSEIGRYRITLPDYKSPDEEISPFVEFNIKDRSFLSQLGITLLYQPIYNALIGLVAVLPGMNLGFAIILLTIIVRLLLFIPTYRSLSHQTELQALQPELEKIRKKYAADKEKQARMTMDLYKERGVNPCGSCLPMLIQLPVLWAMYRVLADGLDPSNHILLYQPLKHINLTEINTSFVGMDLTMNHAIYLAIVVALLQFLSMKMIQWMLPPEAKKVSSAGQAAATNMAMTYVMPLFIGWLSYSYQAGLGLYWGTSTLFGIGQQIAIKKAKDREKEKRNSKNNPPGGPSNENVSDAEFRDAS